MSAGNKAFPDQLVDELKRREGVESVSLSPYAEATVPAEGPAVVLVVTD